MSQIELLGRLIKDYKIWTLKLSSTTTSIENNILQKGSGNNIEEKVMSIGIAFVVMFIVTGLFTLFGGPEGFLVSLVFFGIGLFLSKSINKKIFGVERELESLADDEKMLLKMLQEINEGHKRILERINSSGIIVNFRDYVSLSSEFTNAISSLQNYNTKHLAYKYRLSHKIVTAKYKQQIGRFHEIYANK